MKHIFIFISILIGLQSNGQDIKRGFKSLEKKDYEKAKEAFAKNIADEPENIGANFGMALILADEQSTLFNVVDSWQYIEKMKGNLDKLPQEDIDIIGEYFLNTEERRTSRPVKKKMEIAIEAVEARLIKYIREENNLEAVYAVLERYPDFRFHDNVIHIRNQFEYRKYEKINTLAAYEEFISKFPDAAQIEKADRNRNRLAYEEVKSKNTVAAYSGYLVAFPSSEFIQSIIKLRNSVAFSDAKKLNTLEAFDEFIISYPDALEIAEAKTIQQNLLYEKARKVQSLEAYNEFISKYPDGRYFVDIFNLKSAELGTRFLTVSGISGAGISWIRGFDNNGFMEKGGAVAVTEKGEFILACNTRENDTAHSDVWVLKLDSTGKMLWNKFVGQAFDDSVCNVLVDSKGDIIVLGYTWLSADRNSNMGWMFKLGNDGKKLWNKNLGKIEINSSAIDNSDRLYIGGSIATDSLNSRYSLTIFTSDARKQSQRIFTGKGTVNDLKIDTDGKILIASSNWLVEMDSKRYILWEDSLKTSLNALYCQYSPNGNANYTGTSPSAVFYAKYSNTGKKLWMQEFPKTDSTQTSMGMAVLGEQLLVLEQKSDGSKIKLFASDGKINNVKELPEGITLYEVIATKKSFILLLGDKDLYVVSNSGLGAL